MSQENIEAGTSSFNNVKKVFEDTESYQDFLQINAEEKEQILQDCEIILQILSSK